MPQTEPELDALKSQMKATWMAGDFGEVAKHIDSAAQEFVARRDVRAGMRVLDVACGTGNLAVYAAKAGAAVTGVDIATNLIRAARSRAAREGLQIQYDEGDAEEMPYPDASFDLTITMFGAMFAPRQDVTAAELVRVTRPGGRIGMANWAPTGFVSDLFRTSATHAPPPPGAPSPLFWGEEANVRTLFGDKVSELRCTPATADLRYPFSVSETVEFYKTYFGPTLRAFSRLDEAGQAAFRRDLEAIYAEHNVATDGTVHIKGEYLDVDARR